MFIDIRATKLMDSPYVLNLLRHLDERRINIGQTKSAKEVQKLMHAIYQNHTGELGTNINYYLTEHISVGAAHPYIKTLQGCYRNEFRNHVQIHVDMSMAILSFAGNYLSSGIGLLIPNTQATSDQYFSSKHIHRFLSQFAILNKGNEIGDLAKEAHFILRKTLGATTVSDYRKLVRFIRVTMYYIPRHPEFVFDVKQLKFPADFTKIMQQEEYDRLFPFVCKVYLEIAKRHGNLAISTHEWWK